MVHENVLQMIGQTPLVEIRRLNPHSNVKILAKIECRNPGGSIKDRVALAMIEAAEASGELTPDKTIIEATSGNTGIGLAMVAAVKGYRIKLLMSEAASEERKMILRAFGAEIEQTPARLATDGAIELAYRMAREEPDKYVLMDQYNNPASIAAHYRGTAREIWDQTGGSVTHVVACLGTTGTAMGLVKGLKELSGGAVRVVAVEPFAGHKIQGLKNMHESYPPGIYDKKALDAVLNVEDEEAFGLCRRLAREEGILAGMSSGAALAGALKVAAGLSEGVVVAIFPDSGERYLSTSLYAPRSERGVKLVSAATGRPVTLASASGLYTLGPSLDEPGDLSAWRRAVLLDVLARHLEAEGGKPLVAVGLADMDDRTLSAARAEGKRRADFAREATARVRDLGRALGLREATLFPQASSAVERAVALCRKLLAKGLAYEKLRSVYFDVLRDKRYGCMACMDADKVSVGKTVDLEAYVKENPRDFTLLKRASLMDLKQGEVLETEWGNVRPSWFLQLAAAALESLPRLDVVLAGEAHQFPHLENLRALWTAEGREPQAWLVDKRVAPTEGEPADLSAALDECGNPRVLRMWLLSGSYRKSLPLTRQSLSMWGKNWRKVQDCAASLTLQAGSPGEDVPDRARQAVFDLKAAFSAALEDDLSLHQFWPALFGFVKTVNGLAAKDRLGGAGAAACLKALRGVDRVLGILDPVQLPVPQAELPDAVHKLLAEREAARERKDFAASDALRDRIAEAGYRLEDTAAGTRVFKE
ncbi:MAG TPA: cysteine synthase [Desulfovibrio sp.]|uniref:cysteine synthase n=1 Tax=Desulfovibrio sp. TaxID=885 RepID=UPI002B5C745C|nr:cysteine synthase [Desulfovibrio sp.]HMM39054.1 cysteine synthase [Desulfovibrio sp.]